MLRRLDRYVLRTFVTSFVPVALGFGIIFVFADGFARLDKFLRSDVPLARALLDYYSAMLPAIYVRFGAFLTLAAGMFAVARLQRNNELMPALAGGISVHRVLAPVLLAGLGLAVVQGLDSELLIPRIAPQIRAASRFSKQRDISPGILRDKRGNTLYAMVYRSSTRTLEWVTFRVHDEEGRERRVYWAEAARFAGAASGTESRWILERGIVRDMELLPPSPTAQPGEPPAPPRYAQRTFGGGPEGIPIETTIQPIDIESLTESQSLLSFEDLREQYRRQRYLTRLRVQLHDRIAAPLAHVILLLLGLPFVLRPDGGRGAAGVFVGTLVLLLISAGFFVATFLAQSIGADGAVDPFIAAWTPTVIFGLAGIWTFGRIRT